MLKPNGGVGITGVGKYLPKQCLTNKELARRLKVEPEWIEKRTGIQSRYIISNGESASSMSVAASKEALKRAKVEINKISLIICCTSSGDYVYPATACKVQYLLGAKHAGAFDISAGAAGFQTGLCLASDRLHCDERLQNILVIGTAVQSSYIDWDNSKTSILFGDGSGAAVISRVPKGYGILVSEMLSRGESFDAARLRGGGSSFPLRSENVNEGLQYIEIDGMKVAREFIRHQPNVIRGALKKAGLAMENVNLFIFHQANLRLIQFLMNKMNLPMSKTHTNVERFGNTSDASLAIALCEAVEQKRIQRGDIIILSGVGAGFIFGATVLKWY